MTRFTAQIEALRIAIRTWLTRKHTAPQLIGEVLFQLLAIHCFIVAYIVLSCINLFRVVRIGFLEAGPLGHLALNLDLFLRRRQLNEYPRDALYILFVYHAANRQLLRMFSRRFIVVESHWLGRLLSLMAILNTRFFQRLDLDSNEYREYQATHCELAFTVEEECRGIAELRNMGLPDDAWFVCIFARDSMHYAETYGLTDSPMSVRDGDIDTYIEATKYIVARGGYVIRLGKHVAKPFGFEHPRVIDYALKCRSDFMDVYLTAKCRFFIGTASGGSDMARIFDKHHLAVNWTQIGWAPWGKNEIYMSKTLCYRDSGEQVDYIQALRITNEWRSSLAFDIQGELDRLGLILVANTSDQILEATKEMLARIDGTFVETKDYKARLARYFELRHQANNFCRYVYSRVASNYLQTLKL